MCVCVCVASDVSPTVFFNCLIVVGPLVSFTYQLLSQMQNGLSNKIPNQLLNNLPF